ncbi:cysteine peptidase family C39 domain-containing protein [Rhodohalobacter sulfatireducens]|uniref:cysteine peptidase family C39 domain-containing protein n=1 Tax=Rhodohalobacter sulfatireducens TaxID=2911366 RepID=UPI0034E294B6
MIKFLYYRQHDAMDCGSTCFHMVAKHYGRSYKMEILLGRSGINREGISLLSISEVAENIGFRTIRAKLKWEQLVRQVPPTITMAAWPVNVSLAIWLQTGSGNNGDRATAHYEIQD